MRFTRPDWPAPANVVALTTLKPSSMGDEALLPLLPGVSDICRLQQVHGVEVVDAALAPSGCAADASFSREAGKACLVITADCLPLLLCDRAGREVAAVHAGWRGLCAGIIEQTLSRLHADPADLLAWLGPAISQPHFEVGAEVREAFMAAAGSARRCAVASCFLPGIPGKFYGDLYQLARLRLTALGVTSLYGADRCSYAEADDFYSYRRDGQGTGRMASVVAFT